MFSPDSKFMEVIGRITDLVLLNLLFLLTCLPLFTIGASLTALYTVCFQLMREECGSIGKTYFRAFKENFRQGTMILLILATAIVPALYYFSLLFQMDSSLRYAGFLFILMVLIFLMAASYVFPWVSQFENSTAQALKNALILSISRLPRTICILVINLLPLIVRCIDPDLFIRISFLWVALYFSAAAYMNAGLLWHVFKPYQNV